MKRFCALLITLLSIGLLKSTPPDSSICESMGISAGAGRVFFFTNKQSAFYYAAAHEQFYDGWMGFTVDEQRIFNDYTLRLENGALLQRENAAVTVYPHQVTRKYANGITETFLLADGEATVCWIISGTDKIQISFSGLKWEAGFRETGNGYTAPLDALLKNRWAKLSPANGGAIRQAGNWFTVTGAGKGCRFTFSVTENEGIASAKDPEALSAAKEDRINQVLLRSRVVTGNSQFDLGYLWIAANLDALITRQGGMDGIYAGLPWFNNYWGRDTFISLPGATYTQGNTEEAKIIIRSFAQSQLQDSTSPYWGRVPNRVTMGEKIYNTTDGTPRLVIEAWNTYLYSGDREFLQTIYPVMLLAAEGTLQRFTDSLGFLTHADAETWMDAVGGSGPWSPRGNRANDIQALWYRQLRVTAAAADCFADSANALRFTLAADKLRDNFLRFYYGAPAERIADRLLPDGRRDTTARPNVFFVINEPDLTRDYRQSLHMLARGMAELVYPYGVLSLSHLESNFHPFHEYPPFYVKDAAYHNGIIWQWVTGPVVQALTAAGLADTAWRLTHELINQALYRGGAGCIAELSDALPRPGEQEAKLSGTFVQAWSHAEFIRNVYQDYLGVKVDMPANAVYFIPRMPKALPGADFTVHAGTNQLRIKYEMDEKKHRVSVMAIAADSVLDIGIALLNYAGANFQFKTDVRQGDTLIAEVPSFSRDTTELYVRRNGSSVQVNQQVYLDPETNSALYSAVQFAVPALRKDIKALQGPRWEVLPHTTIKKGVQQQKLLLRAKDPLNDEQYSYPMNPAFKRGMLDLREFSIHESDTLYHFSITMQELSNPGWHNEYGFQLTYISILAGSGTGVSAGKNSGYTAPKDKGFAVQINVGGGIEVCTPAGETLAAYLPQPEDIKDPLGSVSSKTIRFALPKRLTGKLSSNSRITLLCGAQDDHGGGGVGEFRQVEAQAGEWNGGGKVEKDGNNVYDVLYINQEKQ